MAVPVCISGQLAAETEAVPGGDTQLSRGFTLTNGCMQMGGGLAELKAVIR